jgi:hypothetical protein
MSFNHLVIYKKHKLFFISLLIAFLVILNFFMLNKVISSPNDIRGFEKNVIIKY